MGGLPLAACAVAVAVLSQSWIALTVMRSASGRSCASWAAGSITCAVPRGEDGAELGGGHLLRVNGVRRVRPRYPRAQGGVPPLLQQLAGHRGDGEHGVRRDLRERRRGEL